MEELKFVFITYNQAYHPFILRCLSRNNLKGYTSWDGVQGRGTYGGEPHLGNHAWPTMNQAMVVVCPAGSVDDLLEDLHKLDEDSPEQGLRAFVLNVEKTLK
ncbi:Uncharacterised protein [Porphyromonas macacae]|uniref:Nitrogen regulatory protein P-II n=1 Tax=Porphyromonas macacae TaxID=28115 RepID=A0A379EBX6_9PORP|nr:PG0541 family transporter-associated protein [Porphyromonas macacae]SUB89854.1 Uncharacterised protein [Porphyromonas macacae]